MNVKDDMIIDDTTNYTPHSTNTNSSNRATPWELLVLPAAFASIKTKKPIWVWQENIVKLIIIKTN